MEDWWRLQSLLTFFLQVTKLSLASAVETSVERGSARTVCHFLCASVFSSSASEMSGGIVGDRGLWGFVRSMTLLEALAALVRASFVDCRSTEKEILEAGLLQSSIREISVGPRSSL